MILRHALYQFITHCYVTPDGKLAMSDMIDPKTMRYGGEMLFQVAKTTIAQG